MKREAKIFLIHSPEYRQSLMLRYKILRLPLGLQFTEEELKKDETDIHFGLFEGERMLACLRLKRFDNKTVRMCGVAVDDEMQGKGLGAELSRFAEEYAIQQGFQMIFCLARKTAVPFYQKLGYKIVSDEFTEVTIPHYKMEKNLIS